MKEQRVLILSSYKRWDNLILPLCKGEVLVLTELLKGSGAFREYDSNGCLPLHRAAVQPVLEVLKTVLRCKLFCLVY